MIGHTVLDCNESDEHSSCSFGFDSTGGTQPAEVCPGLTAYRDDAEGTLMKMYTSSAHWRDWCPRCKWTRQQICNATTGCGDGSSSPSLDDLGGIWLHAYRWGTMPHLLDCCARCVTWSACFCYRYVCFVVLFTPHSHAILLTCSYKVPESGIDVEAPLPAWATGGSPVAV